MSTRKAYLILSAIQLVMFLALGGFVIRQVHATEHKFCQVISASIAGKPTPQQPADPKANPSRERLYQNYVIVKNLGVSLGCL